MTIRVLERNHFRRQTVTSVLRNNDTLSDDFGELGNCAAHDARRRSSGRAGTLVKHCTDIESCYLDMVPAQGGTESLLDNNTQAARLFDGHVHQNAFLCLF